MRARIWLAVATCALWALPALAQDPDPPRSPGNVGSAAGIEFDPSPTDAPSTEDNVQKVLEWIIGRRLQVEEEDGLPSGKPQTLKVTNTCLTDNGDGSFSLDLSCAATSALTVAEQDGAPSGTPSALEFTNDCVTDEGGGTFAVDLTCSQVTASTITGTDPDTDLAADLEEESHGAEHAEGGSDAVLSGDPSDDHSGFATAVEGAEVDPRLAGVQGDAEFDCDGSSTTGIGTCNAIAEDDPLVPFDGDNWCVDSRTFPTRLWLSADGNCDATDGTGALATVRGDATGVVDVLVDGSEGLAFVDGNANGDWNLGFENLYLERGPDDLAYDPPQPQELLHSARRYEQGGLNELDLGALDAPNLGNDQVYVGDGSGNLVAQDTLDGHEETQNRAVDASSHPDLYLRGVQGGDGDPNIVGTACPSRPGVIKPSFYQDSDSGQVYVCRDGGPWKPIGNAVLLEFDSVAPQPGDSGGCLNVYDADFNQLAQCTGFRQAALTPGAVVYGFAVADLFRFGDGDLCKATLAEDLRSDYGGTTDHGSILLGDAVAGTDAAATYYQNLLATPVEVPATSGSDGERWGIRMDEPATGERLLCADGQQAIPSVLIPTEQVSNSDVAGVVDSGGTDTLTSTSASLDGAYTLDETVGWKLCLDIGATGTADECLEITANDTAAGTTFTVASSWATQPVSGDTWDLRGCACEGGVNGERIGGKILGVRPH